MTEVIRLLRLSLLLRLVSGAVGMGVVVLVFGTSPWFLQFATVLPSLLLLGVTFVAQRHGWVSRRCVRWLIALTILAFALEIAGSSLFLAILLGGSQIRPEFAPGVSRIMQELGSNAHSPVGVLLLAVLIPPVLGAWVDGKRGALRWAFYATFTSLFGGAVMLLTQLRLPLSGTPAPSLGVGEFVALCAVVFVMCYFVGSLADQQREEQRQLEAANRQLTEQAHLREHLAATRERVRLARDLHDTVAQTLAGLAVQLNAVSALTSGAQPELQRELAYASKMLEDGLGNTRRAIADLRANAVAELGLSGALQRLADLVSQRGRAQVTFEQIGDAPELSDEVGDTLFRIAQEALANVERHARAQHAEVLLRNAPGDAKPLTLIVSDDGSGFDVSALDDQRFGLRGMQERAEQIGAHLRIDSTVGQGTRVTVTLKR
jgi:signal transduction histidine kinase